MRLHHPVTLVTPSLKNSEMTNAGGIYCTISFLSLNQITLICDTDQRICYLNRKKLYSWGYLHLLHSGFVAPHLDSLHSAALIYLDYIVTNNPKVYFTA